MTHSIPEVGSLEIYLESDLVGEIVVRADDRAEFSFSRGYLAMHPRPALGQNFEDDLRSTWRSRMQLPPFFSNLLPEERLRELVADQIGVSPAREAHLLAYLGEDLIARLCRNQRGLQYRGSRAVVSWQSAAVS